MTDTRTFTCFTCKQPSETDWSEEEARAEAEAKYGTVGLPEDLRNDPEVVVLCESCNKAVQSILKIYNINPTWTEPEQLPSSPLSGLKVQCFRCGLAPVEIEEYRLAVVGEGYRVSAMSCLGYVVREEGTYNMENGHFACTDCYIAIGMPIAPSGWKAP